ncbi:hypothetical protein FD754_007511 [Muntiacus muntjak]|uniref:Exocyst complex subunit EXOC6/Sec15 C-terminal domain-containing protein n=1 Tax=Muntiacus muntjak TaxID=9888 RepID=A0A5N3WRG2_MUNMU|nr:hypothetical protein FD754_007511 [Muntiacus muntjak]
MYIVVCTQRRQWQPTPVLLPGKSHGWRSLVACNSWGCDKLDTTERLHFDFSLSCIGEGNGNALHSNCEELLSVRGMFDKIAKGNRKIRAIYSSVRYRKHLPTTELHYQVDLCSIPGLGESLGWEDPLEKGMATHFNILAWTEEPSGLWSIESQRLLWWPAVLDVVMYHSSLFLWLHGEFYPCCLHIGARETFENYYRKQRRKQARLVLQPPSNMHETLDGYRKYFNQIVGFFVVEDHILHTTQGLVNRAYIDELWEMALSKTVAALRTHSVYGFPVNQLFDMLLEIRDQYSETLLKKWSGIFRNILDSDNYSPIPVTSEEMYKKVIGQFPFQDTELEKLVQIIINTTHLEKSCKYLEEFITNITNVLPETVHTTKLYGTTTFKDARHAAEEEIYTNLNQKIDQFLQLADYDWMTGDLGSKASDYLVDLIAFLRSTFAVFTHLPVSDSCFYFVRHIEIRFLKI